MITIAHNLDHPYSLFLTPLQVTKVQLAGILVQLCKEHGCVKQAPNKNPKIMAYIFNSGYVVNVQH